MKENALILLYVEVMTTSRVFVVVVGFITFYLSLCHPGKSGTDYDKMQIDHLHANRNK